MKPLQLFAALTVLSYSATLSQEPDPFGGPAPVELSLSQKLKQFIIPSIEFYDTPLRDALDFIQTRSVELDAAPADPTKRGVSIILDQGRGNAPDISLDVKNMPLGEALKIVARLAELEMVVEKHAVLITTPEKAKASKTPEMIEKQNAAVAAVRSKLDTIVVPSIEFQNTPFPEAVGFLAGKGFELDPEKNENQKGVNIVVDSPPQNEPARITLKMSNVSFGEALRYVCSQAGMEFSVKPDTVVISPILPNGKKE